MEEKTITIEIHCGRAAAWEWGGSHRNSGFAQIVADAHGKPKKPILVRKQGHLALGEHALVPVQAGDLIIRSEWGPRNWTEVLRITNIDPEEKTAAVELVARNQAGCWKPPLPPKLGPAVLAAEEKSKCYHCRGPHYVEEEE